MLTSTDLACFYNLDQLSFCIDSVIVLASVDTDVAGSSMFDVCFILLRMVSGLTSHLRGSQQIEIGSHCFILVSILLRSGCLDPCIVLVIIVGVLLVDVGFDVACTYWVSLLDKLRIQILTQLKFAGGR